MRVGADCLSEVLLLGAASTSTVKHLAKWKIDFVMIEINYPCTLEIV